MIWDELHLYTKPRFNRWLLQVLNYSVQFLFYTKFKYFLTVKLANRNVRMFGWLGEITIKQLNSRNYNKGQRGVQAMSPAKKKQIRTPKGNHGYLSSPPPSFIHPT